MVATISPVDRRSEEPESAVPVGTAGEVRDRLQAFLGQVTAGVFSRSEPRATCALYARGLLDPAGLRKSAEPLWGRSDRSVTYESLQHFLADSRWDPGQLTRNVVELVYSRIDPVAWVIDDTGFAKDGKMSPGVARQYSGTLGKIGNCQIGVSIHAAGTQGTLPLSWALYLPDKAWCQDSERRRRAKIPDHVAFQTKPQLATDLATRAAGWKIDPKPILGDEAYGKNNALRTGLNDAALQYVLAVDMDANVWPADTAFSVPDRTPGSRGRAPRRPVADRPARSIQQLVDALPDTAFRELRFRDDRTDDLPSLSHFAMVRVIAEHPVKRDQQDPREEWLIVERPDPEGPPSDYWISNLPADTDPEELARLARLRWTIELDYKQLKGHLGLDHYEGRSWAGWHHHVAMVTMAHAFLTLERLDPKAPRPD